MVVQALRRQRQVYLYEFKDGLVYIASSKLPGLHSETLPQGGMRGESFLHVGLTEIRYRLVDSGGEKGKGWRRHA